MCSPAPFFRIQQQQVARKLGLQASAVSKSEKRALRKLREMLEIA